MSSPAPLPFHPADPDPDQSWADRIRTGDTAAYESVFRALYQPLVAYVLRIVDSRAAAEDLVAELFLTLWKRRSTLEVTSGSLTAYLFGAARNRALDHVRYERMAARWRDKEESAARLARVTPDRQKFAALDDAVEADLALAIKGAVDALPERCREVFLMSRQRGLTYQEIARDLGISHRTVENHIALALRTLRTKLSRFLV